MRAFTLSALGLLLAGCPAPGGPAPIPTADVYNSELSSAVVYTELVEAGCLAPDDGGAAAIDQEHASADQPSWLPCLFNGGSVRACGVSCGGD